MTSDDPNARRTRPFAPGRPPDATVSDPWATLPFAGLPPPITEPVPDWPPGLTRYRPLHALGSGGMGVVYLCHDTLLDRQVALKMPGLGRTAPQDRIDFALAEARAAARLHHHGICPLFEAGVCDGVPYLTMGFVQGPTLAAELKRLGPCPPHYAARMLRAVAEAMQYAHDHGVIHRDLKPGNILLTADHQPIVTDFGLAVRLDHDEPADGVVTGTPHYMAPEQWAGDAAAITQRTDVFALGVILFEMLTGRVPFDGTAHQVREKVLNEPLPAVGDFRPDVPPELADVVATATARDPADRFPGMAAFADALNDFLRTEQRPNRKPPAWVWWLVGGLTAAMALSLLFCGLGFLLPTVLKPGGKPATSTSDAVKRQRVTTLTDQGREALGQEQWGKALSHFNEAIALDPTATQPRQMRAIVYQEAGKPEEALSDWSECLRLDPDDTFCRQMRADLLLDMKRWADALADLNALVGRNWQRESLRESWLLIRRAEAWYGLGQYDDATYCLDLVIREDGLDNPFGDAANAYYLRALVRKATGDLVGADADMAVAKMHAADLTGRFAEQYKNGPWPTPAPPPTPPSPPRK